MNKILDLLARIPARQLTLLFAGVLLLVAALLWVLGIQAPLARLALMHGEQARLTVTATDPGALRQQNDRLAAQIALLSRDLDTADLARSPDQMLVRLISEVDRIGLRHAVQLSGAMPGPRRRVVIFDEIPFDLDARGSYGALMAWMADIENSLPTLSIVRFDIQSTDVPPQLAMKIRIAAYRPQEPRP
ncbi:Tfp pilus assembly protein PilO [Actimicrobium sp. GrIS 1.19]|uniref:type 4a pilus biogenesis protein PilO n=1 Tax=Actimicrobium sp. GrIS 1.19 TaxID=3071708 RepID=UPI002DF9615E|nr:Tfp pilus assembly protein PilO [Actimicrobium sp. GrIS 1.19]